MKRFLIIALAAVAVLAFFWLFVSKDKWRAMSAYVENSDILTLESRHTAEELMETHRAELIGNSSRTYQEPILQFHPYLLLDVKYYDTDQKTKQGSILWSLVDGEMVIDSETWGKTHGFEDAINANASAQEFRLLHLLADAKGSLSREKLQQELGLQPDELSAIIESAKQKQLVIAKGNDIILHFQDPLFHVTPQTKLDSALVLKSSHLGKKIPARYNAAKIERIAKAAFGPDFTIRETKEVFLPVLRLSVLNPDGSLLITDWNAITGARLNRS